MTQITAVVTGGTGFVGNSLVRALLARGATVRIITSGTAARHRVENLGSQVTWWTTSDDDLDAALRDATHFFNFAVAYDRPTIDDETLWAVNVSLPLRILRRLQASGLSTTCVFGDTFFRKYAPEATRQPRYTRSKTDLALRLQEMAASASAAGIRLALLQIEQVYGPGESFTKVFPYMTRQMLENTSRIAATHGLQQRDFIHVNDVVAAALTVADSDWQGLQRVECGTGISTAVREVLTRLKALTRSSSVLGFGDLPADQSIDISCADTTWLHSRGWEAGVALEDGLAELVGDVSARLGVAAS